MGLHVRAGPRGAPPPPAAPGGASVPALPPTSSASLTEPARALPAASAGDSLFQEVVLAAQSGGPSRRERRHLRRRPRVRETQLLWAPLHPLGPEVHRADRADLTEGRKGGREEGGRREGGRREEPEAWGLLRAPQVPQAMVRLSLPWAAWPQKRQWAPRKEMLAPLQEPPEVGRPAGGH